MWEYVSFDDGSGTQSVVSAPSKELALIVAAHRLTLMRQIGVDPIKAVEVRVISDNEPEARYEGLC